MGAPISSPFPVSLLALPLQSVSEAVPRERAAGSRIPSLGTVVNHAAEGIALSTPLEGGTVRRGFFAKVADVALVF